MPGRMWNLSFRTRDRTCVPLSSGKWILNHWMTRKSPRFPLNTEFGQIIPKSWGFFLAHHAILVPRSGVLPGPSAVIVESPNHWTTREFRPGVLYRLRSDGLGAKACVLPLENLSLSGLNPLPASRGPAVHTAPDRQGRLSTLLCLSAPATQAFLLLLGLAGVMPPSGLSSRSSLCVECSPPTSPWLLLPTFRSQPTCHLLTLVSGLHG